MPAGQQVARTGRRPLFQVGAIFGLAGPTPPPDYDPGVEGDVEILGRIVEIAVAGETVSAVANAGDIVAAQVVAGEAVAARADAGDLLPADVETAS